MTLNVFQREGGLARHVRRHPDHACGGVSDGGDEGFEVFLPDDVLIEVVGVEWFGSALEVGLNLGEFLDDKPADALHNDGYAAVRHGDVFEDVRQRAYFVQIL